MYCVSGRCRRPRFCRPARGTWSAAGTYLKPVSGLRELVCPRRAAGSCPRKLQSLFALQVSGTCEALMEVVQLGADDAPDLLLGVGVRRDWWEAGRAANPKPAARAPYRPGTWVDSTWMVFTWWTVTSSPERVTGA